MNPSKAFTDMARRGKNIHIVKCEEKSDVESGDIISVRTQVIPTKLFITDREYAASGQSYTEKISGVLDGKIEITPSDILKIDDKDFNISKFKTAEYKDTICGYVVECTR